MKTGLILLVVILSMTNLIAQEYQVGDHELLLMPTAFTMEKGKSYISDYELVFLNYTYAVSSRTHLGVFTLFPVTKDFIETTTLGFKQKFTNAEFINSAIWVTYTPKISGLTLGAVASIGKISNGFHLGLSSATELEGGSKNWEIIYMLGYRYDISQKLSLIAEYTNFSSFIEEDFNGLISLGIRFRGQSISWDLAAVRPLESTGDLIALPLVKATYLIE